MMTVVAKLARDLKLQNGYRTVINNGTHGCQDKPGIVIQVIGGQQLKWPPGTTNNPEVTQISNMMAGLKLESQSQEDTDKEAMKKDLMIRELGFSVVVEMMIEKMRSDPECSLIGHNMMYDILYFYNQFIAPLPDTYQQFVQQWFGCFPRTFDTKVLSFQANYFGQTILGKIFDKCTRDKKLKDVLSFQFDLKNGFTNYEGSQLLAHYHEAAYDAYMTGYAFAKILKFKEIDEIYQRKRHEKQSNKDRRNQNKQKEEEKANGNEARQEKPKLPDP